MADTVKIVCSTIPGFESVALNECKDKLGVEAQRDVRGRISFEIEVENVVQVVELRSVHHYWVVVSDIEDFFNPNQTMEEACQEMCDLPARMDWDKALRTWKTFCIFKESHGGLDPVNKKKRQREGMEESGDESTTRPDYANIDPLTAGEKLRFRATGTRTGTHIFTSQDGACHLGGGVNDALHWKVDLKNFDIEVVVYIVDNFISVGIQLTKEAQSLRNITHFGPTTLKANISFCLLKTSMATTGDIICDPMCGGGSIPLEGANSLPGTFNLGGDNHEIAMNNAMENIESMSAKKQAEKYKNTTTTSSRPCTINMSAVIWDVYALPLRDACVDHIVSDLPFGKKIGSKERNMFLYPKALKEMARVCRTDGRCILLTHHKEAMKRALTKVRLYWRLLETRRINMGGLNVAVYMLIRTNKAYVKYYVPDRSDTNTDSNSETTGVSDEKTVKSDGESIDAIGNSLADVQLTPQTAIASNT